MVLTHDQPKSKGVENALKRAKQLIDFTWTPPKPFPSTYGIHMQDGKRQNVNGFLPAHLPQKGVIYSSCRFVEKYIGWNISLETFVTAMENPNSILYTKSFWDNPSGGMHSYYGLVCSMYVSYVLQLPYRQACAYWDVMPGIERVDTSTLDNLALCDVVVDPRHHVAIITDIQRDETGKVQIITVCESKKPLSTRTDFTPDSFRKYWLEDGYHILRYGKLDEITYTPDPFVHVEGDPITERAFINRALMLNFGNKANYRIGDETVELSVFEDGWEGIAVSGPDGKEEIYPITDGKLVLNPTVAGKYSACLVRGAERSPGVQWCMVNIDLQFETQTVKAGESVRVRFANAAKDEKVFHYVINNDKYYVKDNYYFTEGEMETGEALVPPVAVAGKYYVLVYAKNDYGVYTSRYAELIVEE